MKTIITLTFIILISLSVAGQDMFTSLTEKYASQEGFSATNLTRDMFDLYLKKKQVEPDSPVSETLKKLNNILVVSQSTLTFGKPEDKSINVVSEIHSTILNHYKAQSFTLFKTENRMGEDLKVFLKKSGEKVNALALVTASATRVVLVELTGDIELANVSDLNKALNIRGLENLDRINGQSDFPVVWRSYSDNNFMISSDHQKQLQQLEEQMKTMSDQKSREIIIRQKEFAEQQREMAERTREMAEKYGRHPIILSTPGDTNMVYYIDGKKVDAKKIKTLDTDQIETIEVRKTDKDKPGKKGEIRITTKK